MKAAWFTAAPAETAEKEALVNVKIAYCTM